MEGVPPAIISLAVPRCPLAVCPAGTRPPGLGGSRWHTTQETLPSSSSRQLLERHTGQGPGRPVASFCGLDGSGSVASWFGDLGSDGSSTDGGGEETSGTTSGAHRLWVVCSSWRTGPLVGGTTLRTWLVPCRCNAEREIPKCAATTRIDCPDSRPSSISDRFRWLQMPQVRAMASLCSYINRTSKRKGDVQLFGLLDLNQKFEVTGPL